MLSALTDAIWSGRQAARLQSAFAIPATRYLCDLSLRTDDLDMVCWSDKHASGRAMAAMAAVEANLIGVSARSRDLSSVQGCDRTLRSWRADPASIRAITYRSCTYVAEHRICRVDCSWRRLVDESPRQQFDSAAGGV